MTSRRILTMRRSDDDFTEPIEGLVKTGKNDGYRREKPSQNHPISVPNRCFAGVKSDGMTKRL